MKKHIGMLAAILSAVIFGISPILVRFTFQGGSNGITATFLRSILAIPILYLILRQKKTSLRLTKKECGDVILFGLLGVTFTAVALTVSYQYIPVGISTTLHFIYPMLVTAAGVLFFHEKIGKSKAAALLLAFAGVLFFMEKNGEINLIGVALALLSGVTYTFYMLGIERTGLKEIPFFKLSFYFCIVASISTGILGLATGKLQLHLTPEAWFFSFLVAILVSVGALSLFQIGIKSVGSSAAAILSTLEPITSILLGALILKEVITFQKLIGCLLILLSVILMTALHSRVNTPAAVPINK